MQSESPARGCFPLDHFSILHTIFLTLKPEERYSEGEVVQLCPSLCNPMDCSLPGSSIHEIFQARVLEWAATSFSKGSSRPRDRTRVSHIAGRRFTVWATRESGLNELEPNIGYFLDENIQETISLKAKHWIIPCPKKSCIIHISSSFPNLSILNRIGFLSQWHLCWFWCHSIKPD